MQDVLKLFLTRLMVVTVLVGAVGFVGGFAFTPKQVSLVGFLTVGIPTLVLATRAQSGLGRRGAAACCRSSTSCCPPG